jgi:hypothetical protein
MLGSVGGILDDASKILGGGQHDGSSSNAPVEYTKGEQLGTSTPDVGGAFAPFDQGATDMGAPIEFLHFGWAFPDSSKNFVHKNSLKDDERNDLPDGPGSRAIMFRAGVEREVVLLNGFVSTTAEILKEKEDSEGGVGQMLGAVGDLLGGGGGATSAAPKAADCNPFNDKVKSVASAVNVSASTYKAVHKAGMDLHQARANYRAFLKKLKEKPGGDSSPGLLSNVNALAGSLPGVGGIFSTISGIATKAFDIYVGFYTKIAWEQEKVIEAVCRKITIASIEGNAKMIYPVWGPVPDAPSAAGGSGSSLPGFLGSATDTVTNTVNDIKDFLGDTPPKDCPGAAYLGDAFSLAADAPKDQPPPPPKELAGLVAEAFKEQIPAIPDFAVTVVIEVQKITLDFTKGAFDALLQRDPSQPIDEDAMFASGRRLMLDRLVNLLVSQVSFLKTAKDFSVGVQGTTASADKFLGKGLDELNRDLGPKLDPVLEFAMKGFAQRLEALRKTAMNEKAHTMEVYLGRLPGLLSFLFRDTFFPVWDLLVQTVFGGASGPLSGALSAATGAFKSMQGYTDSARDYVAKANKVKNRFDQDGVQAGTGPSNLAGYQQDMQATASRGPNPHQDTVDSSFALKGRQPSGTGQDIKKSEWDEVKKDHQWEKAKTP